MKSFTERTCVLLFPTRSEISKSHSYRMNNQPRGHAAILENQIKTKALGIRTAKAGGIKPPKLKGCRESRKYAVINEILGKKRARMRNQSGSSFIEKFFLGVGCNIGAHWHDKHIWSSKSLAKSSGARTPQKTKCEGIQTQNPVTLW